MSLLMFMMWEKTNPLVTKTHFLKSCAVDDQVQTILKMTMLIQFILLSMDVINL